ncbi:MAG: hypothetical protein AB3X44_08480 [Leptothrix sp. (in: b-proteobacteria)]
MRQFRVQFYKEDGTFIAEFCVEAVLDGEATEKATELFALKFAKEASEPFQAHCGIA